MKRLYGEGIARNWKATQAAVNTNNETADVLEACIKQLKEWNASDTVKSGMCHWGHAGDAERYYSLARELAEAMGIARAEDDWNDAIEDRNRAALLREVGRLPQ